jgi:hypothetical protein
MDSRIRSSEKASNFSEIPQWRAVMCVDITKNTNTQHSTRYVFRKINQTRERKRLKLVDIALVSQAKSATYFGIFPGLEHILILRKTEIQF